MDRDRAHASLRTYKMGTKCSKRSADARKSPATRLGELWSPVCDCENPQSVSGFGAETASAFSRLDGDRSRRRIYLKRVVIQQNSEGGSHSLCVALRKGILDRRRPRRHVCVALWHFGVDCPPGISDTARMITPARTTKPDAPAPPASSPGSVADTHRGWRSRGYIPHCDSAHLVQHMVFGLADAIPPGARPPSALHRDHLLDAGHGSCLLRDPRCASIVLHADDERYRLIAWCIMPNHVHVLVEQLQGWPLSTVVQAWKGASAHAINQKLARKGPLWRREYFDRFMRDEEHLHSTIDYIECNPVASGFVNGPADWQWSSARLRTDARAGEDAGGPR